MLELPECKVMAEQVTHTVKEKVIQNVTAAYSPHKFAFYFGDPAAYHGRLTGKQIDGAQAFGGYFEIIAEDMRIAFQDGVLLRYYAPGEPLPRKHQLHIEFEDGSSLFASIQMYGVISAFQEGENDNKYYRIARDTLSPLSPQYTFDFFVSLLEGTKPSLSAKAFLATEQRIPGLGNGVLQDILWRAGIHPKARVSSLRDGQIETLLVTVKDTLAEMIHKGGRDTEKDLFGTPGGYRCILSKNTLDKPCPACGADIQKAAYLGGSVYFCPSCQK